MRWILILLLFITVCGLGYYNTRTSPWISVADCLEDPEAYDGKLVTRYREPLIGEIFADGFQLIQKNAPSIRVYADTTGLISGKFVGMRAVFHKQGYIEVRSLHVAKRRRYKIWISVLPVFLVGFLCLKTFRWNQKTHCVELRTNA